MSFDFWYWTISLLVTYTLYALDREGFWEIP